MTCDGRVRVEDTHLTMWVGVFEPNLGESLLILSVTCLYLWCLLFTPGVLPAQGEVLRGLAANPLRYQLATQDY